MKTAKFQGGIFKHTDRHGTAYDGDWNVTFERVSFFLCLCAIHRLTILVFERDP